jgi:hypothetical protein
MSDCNSCENCTCRPTRSVGEISLNFERGVIDGDIGGCNAAEVADALMTIVEELRRMDDTPRYLVYDEGSFYEGIPISNEVTR